MSKIKEIRNDMSYLESLANYLMLQLASKDVKPIIDPKLTIDTFDIETLSLARDTIQQYLEKKVENDQEPPKKSVG